LLGQVDVMVKYEQQERFLPLLVVQGGGHSLFGRNWLFIMKERIHSVQYDPLRTVLERHQPVFQEDLGKLRGYEAKINVDPNASPRFCRARLVPYALKDKVELELEHLIEQGIIEPTQYADWAAPIVAVLNNDQTVEILSRRLIKLHRYPIPKIEDLFATLGGGRIFSKLDLSQAYLQVPLSDESKTLGSDKHSQGCTNIIAYRMLFPLLQAFSRE